MPPQNQPGGSPSAAGSLNQLHATPLADPAGHPSRPPDALDQPLLPPAPGDPAPVAQSKRRFTRRKALATLLGGGTAVGGTYALGVEPNWFDHQTLRLPLLPAGSARVKILHLSDFHASLSTPLSRIDRAIAEGLERQPDCCVITGDFITQSLDQPLDYAKTLRALSSAVPTYAVLGNHDGGSGWDGTTGHCPPDHIALDAMLADAGVELLHNRAAIARHHGTEVMLVGTGDLWQEECDVPAAFADRQRLIDQGARPACTVVLTHNPDAREEMPDEPWDLALTGHTHGGQVVIPFLGAPLLPVKDRRFAQGLVPWKGRLVYVTRGVGSLLSLRVNCPPEITHVELIARNTPE